MAKTYWKMEWERVNCSIVRAGHVLKEGMITCKNGYLCYGLYYACVCNSFMAHIDICLLNKTSFDNLH